MTIKVDCEWQPFTKNSTCSSICGRGHQTWIREKTVNASNCGKCDENIGHGTKECFGCDEIGTETIEKSNEILDILFKYIYIYIYIYTLTMI